MADEQEALEPTTPEEAVGWLIDGVVGVENMNLRGRGLVGETYILDGLRERDDLRAGIESLAQEVKLTVSRTKEVVNEKCDQLAAAFVALIRERDKLQARLAEYIGMLPRRQVIRLMCEAWVSAAKNITWQREGYRKQCESQQWAYMVAAAGITGDPMVLAHELALAENAEAGGGDGA